MYCLKLACGNEEPFFFKKQTVYKKLVYNSATTNSSWQSVFKFLEAHATAFYLGSVWRALYCIERQNLCLVVYWWIYIISLDCFLLTMQRLPKNPCNPPLSLSLFTWVAWPSQFCTDNSDTHKMNDKLYYMYSGSCQVSKKWYIVTVLRLFLAAKSLWSYEF